MSSMDVPDDVLAQHLGTLLAHDDLLSARLTCKSWFSLTLGASEVAIPHGRFHLDECERLAAAVSRLHPRAVRCVVRVTSLGASLSAVVAAFAR